MSFTDDSRAIVNSCFDQRHNIRPCHQCTDSYLDRELLERSVSEMPSPSCKQLHGISVCPLQSTLTTNAQNPRVSNPSLAPIDTQCMGYHNDLANAIKFTHKVAGEPHRMSIHTEFQFTSYHRLVNESH